MMTSTVRGLRARLRPQGDRGSLPLLMLVILVSSTLCALLVPMVITQANSTHYSTSRQQALDAAWAGIDMAVGRIRMAEDVSGNGILGKLPCWTTDSGTPYRGSVVSAGDGSQVGAEQYQVYVDYYVVDPVANPAATPMVCSTGYGTFDLNSGQATPGYALITATGTAGTGSISTTQGRTLQTTYVFQVSNTNVPGGIIRLYPGTGATNALCIDAGTSNPNPATTTPVYLQLCSASTPPIAQQVFVYRTDLTLQLLSSVTATNPLGMCLDTVAPLTAGYAIYLKKCGALGSPPYDQQWSFDDNGHFRGSLSTSAQSPGTLSTICINAASQSAGQAVTAATCAGSTSDPTQAWIPAPTVGAGAAADPQYVNYKEFGRCMDVTNQNVNSDHFIDYPCKQNPYAGAVAWNQKFTYVALTGSYGQMTTVTGGVTYCITSPGTNNGYVTLKTCTLSGGTAVQQRWVRNGGAAGLSYSAKYNIVDSFGFCLGLAPPYGSVVWSSIDVETCTGSLDQKWNASPDLSQPSEQNTLELGAPNG
jgi:hypothetical protein